MLKRYIFLFFVILYSSVMAQEAEGTYIKTDYWRQHNLLKYQRNLMNPTFSFVGQQQKELSLWGRIQWVGVNDSPKTYVVNYGGKFNNNTGAGLGLFQNNNGLFIDMGLLVNYARAIQLSKNSWLTFGLNFSVLKSGLDKNAFQISEQDNALLDTQDTFSIVGMPGFNLSIGNFDIGVMSENLLDYNLTSGTNTGSFSDKIFGGHFSYTHRFNGSGLLSDSKLKTLLYGKKIPNATVQYGAGMVLDAPSKGYAQLGYNSFYGISGGLGVRVGQGIVVGVIAEKGLSSSSSAFGATYEVSAVIEFGNKKKRDEPITFKDGPRPDAFKKKSKKKEVIVAESDAVNKKTEIDETNKKKATLIKNDDENEALVVLSKKEKEKLLTDENIEYVDILTLDAMAFTKDSDKSELKKIFPDDNKNPRYKVVERVAGTAYGFYLVANVFSQKYYFEMFVKLLKKRGLNPKSFYNEENEFYYVYLKKYDKLSNAERDRRTKMDGKYFEETWILWVRFD